MDMRRVSIDTNDLYEVFTDEEGNKTNSKETENVKFLKNLVEYRQGDVFDLDQELFVKIMEDKDKKINVPMITYSSFSVRVMNSISSPSWSDPTEVAILPLLFSLGYIDLIKQFMDPILQEPEQKLELEDAYDLFDLAIPNNNIAEVKYLVEVAGEDFAVLLAQNKEVLVENSKKYGAADIAGYIDAL